MARASVEYGPPLKATYKTPFRPQAIWAAFIVAHFFLFASSCALGFLSGIKVSLFVFG